MSKVAIGSIPEKILYVCSIEKEVNVGCAWDISWHAADKAKNVKMKVLPAFPVDSTDEKTKAKAMTWASNGPYDYATRTHTTYNPTLEEVENKPINNVKVLSLEERGNGGRAYKIAIDKFYVDLREDVMMDTLLKTGVSPGGILNGDFVWAKLGSQMKLVRIGSELHRLLAEFDSKKDMKPIGKRALEFGGLYQDRKKNMAVFLGYVNTTTFVYDGKHPSYYDRDKYKPTWEYAQRFLKKQMLFYEINSYDGTEKCLSRMKDKERNYGYRIKKTHNYIEKIQDVDVPEDITLFLRNQARHQIKDLILEYTGAKTSQYKRDAWSLSQGVCSLSEMLNLYQFEGTPVELFDIKKFLLFS